MVKFEESRARKSPRSRSSSRDSKKRGSFKDRPKRDGGRDSGRGYRKDSPAGRDVRGAKRYNRDGRDGRDRPDVEMTKVTCSSCGTRCEVPFKPTSSKPVYCTDCFSSRGPSSPNRSSSKDLDRINEKLDKIMKSLKIE